MQRDVATPFSDFSLLDVCAFLCFAYHPHEATPANLAACGSSLPALLRPAHQLQVDGLLQAVASTIGNAGADLSLEQLLGCINAADACQLDETSNAAVDELVHRMLAPGALAPADALAVSSQLGRESLVAVLNGVAHMARSRQPVLFSWSVQHFGSLRREVKSPNFSVGGAEWQLRLLPVGDGNGSRTHVSPLLQCLSTAAMPLTAKYTLTVHGADGNQDVSWTATHTFSVDPGELGQKPSCDPGARPPGDVADRNACGDDSCPEGTGQAAAARARRYCALSCTPGRGLRCTDSDR